MICWSCTDFLTRPNACLPACLPTCIPACLPTCIPACLPAVSASGSIRGRGRPDQRLSLIRIVPYGRSLAVHLNSGSPMLELQGHGSQRSYLEGSIDDRDDADDEY